MPNANPHDLPPSAKTNGKTNGNHKAGPERFPNKDAGLSDMKIAHAIKATQVAKPYPKIKHEGAKYIVVSPRETFVNRRLNRSKSGSS